MAGWAGKAAIGLILAGVVGAGVLFAVIRGYLHSDSFRGLLSERVSRTAGVEGRVTAELWRGAEAPPLLFSSFRPEALEGARATAPQVPRALLLDTLWPGWDTVADSLEVVAIITNYQVMSAKLVERLHRAGRRAMVYTVNDPAPAAWLQDIGIDGIVTDAVDRFAPTR